MDRLIELRNERNLSQTQVAASLGISRQAYGHYETGKREPDNETLIKLASLFDVTTDYLLGNSSEKASPPVTEEDVKVALFNGDKNVTPEMWEEVKNFAMYIQAKYKSDGK